MTSKIKYATEDEAYDYEHEETTLEEAIQIYEGLGRRKRSRREVLEFARKLVSLEGLGDKVKVSFASKVFLRDVPTADAGVYRRGEGYVIVVSPEVRYFTDKELAGRLQHEIRHIRQGEI